MSKSAFETSLCAANAFTEIKPLRETGEDETERLKEDQTHSDRKTVHNNNINTEKLRDRERERFKGSEERNTSGSYSTQRSKERHSDI